MEKKQRQRAWLVALLCLSAFLVPVGVRATNPPPLTIIVNDSPNPNFGIVLINSSQTVHVFTIPFTIPSGHTGYLMPLSFGGDFACSPCYPYPQPTVIYVVQWVLNGAQVGYTVSSSIAQTSCSNCGPETSFGLPIQNRNFLNNTISGSNILTIDVQNLEPTSTATTLAISYSYADVLIAEN